MTYPRSLTHGLALVILLLMLVGISPVCAQANTPLLLPGGLAYDAQGNLYFSDTASHLVRRLTPGAVLTTVAGTGTQGFSGDGAPATAAQLDSPGPLALDAAGNLYIGDVHNHRLRLVDAASGKISTVAGTGQPGVSADGLALAVTLIDTPSALAFDAAGNLYFADARSHVVRKVDHTTGFVATVAGNGTQGLQGDGGPARAASLDTPAGLALDASGNLFLSDSHNQRVRRVDAVTGIITTVAGTGIAGFADGVSTSGALRLPRGLTVDASGNLFLVDAGNHRIRRVDSTTGQITTIGGGPVEGFQGDGSPASQAALDTPRSMALSAAGLPTFTDTENARIRQVDTNGVIHTIVGVGAAAPTGLLLAGPGTSVYGSGTTTATLGGAAGNGPVLFFDGTTLLRTVPLTGNAAVLPLSTLGVGAHTLSATYAGDALHGAVVSNSLPLVITPAPVVATPTPATQVYGLPLPALTGSVTGILAQDAGLTQVSFNSAATALSGAGAYPITSAMSGSAAANYTLSTTPAVVTISKAAAAATLTPGLLAHVASTTAGQPGGTVTLLDGNTASATLSVAPSGDAQFSAATLSNGSHTLTASYSGDTNFLAATSAPVVNMIGPSSAADFSIASVGPSTVTIAAGSSAVFSFSETPVNGSLASPVVLSVVGLPSGATASFSPAYLPPGNAAVTFMMTVQTIKTAGLVVPGTVFAVLVLGIFLLPGRRRLVLASVLACGLVGCGDRVNSAGQDTAQSRTYNLTVNASATSSTGATLLHTVNVTLTTN